MTRWLGFRQRPIHPLHRRLRRRLLGLLSNRPPSSQRIYVVTIRGHRFKRIVFPDSHQAEIVASRLIAFGPERIWPRLVLQRERELWVEFVEGRRLDRVDAEVVGKLADLLAVLYGREARLVPIARTPFAQALHDDLEFLNQVGVISDGVHELLDEVARRVTPERVWVGYDCTDAILKNFVVDDAGRLRAVDVECLGADQLLGSGVAKAAVRWLGPFRGGLLEQLRERDVPDFASYLPFVEMSFVAFWLKSSFLEKKRRLLDPALFDRFLGD
jgi:hypothetical protein